jgi:hypothetical protein
MAYELFCTDAPTASRRIPDNCWVAKSDSLRAAIKAACDLITKGIIVWKLKGSDGFTMERRDIETECLRRKGVPPPGGD